MCGNVFLNFLVTVKTAPPECVIRTSLLKTRVKTENEVWFYLKVIVSLYYTTLVKKVMIQTSKRQQNSVRVLFNINIDTNSVDPDRTDPPGAV